jgi:hypothetical protein
MEHQLVVPVVPYCTVVIICRHGASHQPVAQFSKPNVSSVPIRLLPPQFLQFLNDGDKNNLLARSIQWAEQCELCYRTGINFQCCGSGMFILDPNFFHPGSKYFPSRIRKKELSVLTQKIVSKLS